MLRLLVPVLTFVGLSLLPAQFFPARVVSASGQFLFSDLIEVGAWRMPSSGTNTTFSNQGTGGGAFIAGRVVGGEQRIFILGISNGNNPTTGWPLYELGLVNAPSPFTSYATANRATLRDSWTPSEWRGSCPKSWVSSTEQDPIENFSPGSGYYEEGVGLHWTYGNAYNTSANPDWGWCLTDLSANTQTGPWRVKAPVGNGSSFRYGFTRAYYVQDNPFGTGVLLSSTIATNNSTAVWGHSLHKLDALPTPSTPSGLGNPDLTASAGYVDHTIPSFTNGSPNLFSSFRRTKNIVNYESTQGSQTADPSLNSGASSWQQVDQSQGFAAFTNGQKSAIMYFMQLSGKTGQNTPPNTSCNTTTGSAHTTYCNIGGGQFDDHCTCTDTSVYIANTGPTITIGGRFFGVATYSWADMQTSVLNGGAVPSYSIPALEEIDVEEVEGIRLDAYAVGSDRGIVGCCYVNRTTRTIYVTSQGMVGSCSVTSGSCETIILAWQYPDAARPSALLTASFSMAVAAPFYLFRRRKVMT